MLTNLKQLYISSNGIEVLENLDQNVNLTTIDYAANKITKLDNLHTLDKITEFWFNDNQVSDWSEIDKLAQMKELETVYFEWNPIQTLCPADYLRKMKLTLPLLLQIDATLC